jgi:hypothetical protein
MQTMKLATVLLLTLSAATAAVAQEPRADRSGPQAAAKPASHAPSQRATSMELDPRSHSYGLYARQEFRSTKTREEVRAELEEERAAASRRPAFTSQ